MKILIIDDSRSQIRILNKIVHQLKDLETFLALDALEGFVMLRAIPGIRMIIVDYQLPYMNGIDFIKKIRATPPFDKLTVVVSSAKDLTDKYKEAGADHCLIKPYSITELKEIIQKAAEGENP